MDRNPKLLRITTVPVSLLKLLTGQPKFMTQHGFDVILISADGKERAEVILKENCPHIVVPMTRQITLIQDLKCLFKLVKIFREQKPDIVHTHTPKAGLLGMIAAKIAGVKIRMHTVAGLPLMVATGLKRSLLINIERLTYFSASHVYPNSFTLLDFIKQNKLCTDKKLGVIGYGTSNGVDTEEYSVESLKQDQLEEIKKEFNYQADKLYLLSVGRVVKDKGIEELVNVFKKINLIHTDTHLIIVGPLESDLDPISENTLNNIKQHPNITHIHYSNYVKYYLYLATLLIHPSHREGFPNVLLQAGAMGCPIVCSDISGNIDLVVHNKTGLLFKVNDELDMLEKLNYALNDLSFMNVKSINLQQQISEKYSRKFMQEQILLMYTKNLQIV